MARSKNRRNGAVCAVLQTILSENAGFPREPERIADAPVPNRRTARSGPCKIHKSCRMPAARRCIRGTDGKNAACAPAGERRAGRGNICKSVINCLQINCTSGNMKSTRTTGFRLPRRRRAAGQKGGSCCPPLPANCPPRMQSTCTGEHDQPLRRHFEGGRQ